MVADGDGGRAAAVGELPEAGAQERGPLPGVGEPSVALGEPSVDAPVERQ